MIKQVAAFLCKHLLYRTVSPQLALKLPDNTYFVPLINQKCLISSAQRRQSMRHKIVGTDSELNTWTLLLTLNKKGSDSVGKRSYVSKKDYPFHKLKEEELEEDFVRGSGPGGQSVNQTANCVVLKHVPTGIVVKCHETRSLQQNRRRARERLQERIDLHLNGSSSFLALCQEEASFQRKEKKKKNKIRNQAHHWPRRKHRTQTHTEEEGGHTGIEPHDCPRGHPTAHLLAW
ncbi:uncharacterized protein LOC143288469 [Babylonia areolata]|uniref:uncharacterized protein LOC143288469 n=1 Tax=Babylonia areolata TaxID=304850 RepID=UPI003FD3AF04